MLQNFLDALYEAGRWVNGTDAHFWARGVLRSQNWLSPTIQSIHILSVCAIIGSAGLIDLRVLNLASRGQALGEMTRRLLPWTWVSLVLLTATGSMLILNRPVRYFDNIAFVSKITMLLIAIVLTLILKQGIANQDRYWTLGPWRTLIGRVLAVTSLFLWFAILVAGRWIAYV